jgi:hypothetical protein
MTAEKSNDNHKPASAMEKCKPIAMPRYKVMVDDNFHFMDEDERYQHGMFLTAEEAIAACKSIVDKELESYLKQGFTATELYKTYTGFGEDPFIVCVDPAVERVHFSAWEYAYERSQAIISHGKETDDAGLANKTSPDVHEQSKITCAKAALDALRPGEPPLGRLTSEERSWLATAFAHLNRIYENRGPADQVITRSVYSPRGTHSCNFLRGGMRNCSCAKQCRQSLSRKWQRS